MAIANIEYGLSKKLQALKTADFTPHVKILAHENNDLFTSIQGNFSSTNIEYNGSQYVLLPYWDKKPKMSNEYTIVATRTTESQKGIPYIFDQRNSGFEPFCLTNQNTSIKLQIGSSQMEFNERQMNPALMMILAHSFNEEKLRDNGLSLEMLYANKLSNHFSEGNSGFDLSHYSVDAFLNSLSITSGKISSNLKFPTGIIKQNNGGVRSNFNVFEILNKKIRTQFLAQPTFTCANGATLYTQWCNAIGAYVPCKVAKATTDVNADPSIIVYSNLEVSTGVQYGAITQTQNVKLSEYLLSPLFSNPFVEGGERSLVIANAPIMMTLQIDPNYVANMFKISSDNLTSVTTTLVKSSLEIVTYDTDLMNIEETDKMKQLAYFPSLLNALPNPVNYTVGNMINGDDINFTYSYKPSCIERYMAIFLDNEMYRRNGNQFTEIHTTGTTKFITKATNILSNYNLGDIYDLKVIANNEDILNKVFKNDREKKMLFLQQMTCDVLNGTSNYKNLDIISVDKKIEFLDGDSILSVFNSIQSSKSGLPFIILDMVRLMNIYNSTASEFIYPMCDYSTGSVGIQFEITGKHRAGASAVQSYNPKYVATQTNGLPAGYDPTQNATQSIVLASYRLQIYGLKLHTIVQDYKNLTLTWLEIKTNSDAMQASYDELEDVVCEPRNNLELYGNGWFDDVFSKVKSIGKKVIDGVRFAKNYTEGAQHPHLQKANSILNTVSNFSKDNLGYGKTRKRRI